MFAFRNRSSTLALRSKGSCLYAAATLVALCLLVPTPVLAESDVGSVRSPVCNLDTPPEQALLKMLQASSYQQYKGTVLASQFFMSGGRVDYLMEDKNEGLVEMQPQLTNWLEALQRQPKKAKTGSQ